MMSFGDRILLAATVTDIHEGQYMYQACKVCYSKVSDPFSNPQRSVCTKCNSSYTCEDTYFRYCLHLTAADNSCLANVTVFGSILDQFFGAQGSEFYFRHVLRLKQKFRHLGDVIVKTAIENIFVGQNLIFGFKVPKSFYATKSRNQEILLKDICKVTIHSFQKNCKNILPELTAVQLLPQPNTVLTFTVIHILETLERRLDEMGFLEIGKITCGLIKALSRQNLALQGSLHAESSQDQESCKSTLSISLNNSQTTLGLSCDSSLNISPTSTFLQPIGNGINSTISPSVFSSEPKYKDTSLQDSDRKCAPDDRDKTDSMHHTLLNRNDSVQKNSVKNEVKKISLKLKHTLKTDSSGCKTQMKGFGKSFLLNKANRNHSANERSVVSKGSKKGVSSGHSLSSRLSQKPSEITWSVYKYNQEKFGKVRHSKHGKATLHSMEHVKIKQLSLKRKQKLMNSTCESVCEVSDVDIARELSLSYDRIVSEDNSSQMSICEDSELKGSGDWNERSMKGDGVATPVENEVLQPTFPLIDDQSNVFHMNYMPESEDLELFLAAVNSEATGDTGSQRLEETKGANSLISQCINETIEHSHELNVGSIENVVQHSYYDYCTPNETDTKSESKEVAQDQSFTITEEHAAAISFNVTLRRSQKQQSGYQFSKSFTKADNTSTAEQPESEDIWQFLDRFPSTDSLYSPIYYNKPCLSLNLSVNNSSDGEHNLGISGTVKEKTCPLTRTSRLEDRHLGNLLNKLSTGTCNPNFPPISYCSQLNSRNIEKGKPAGKTIQNEHPYPHSSRNNESREDHFVLRSPFSQASDTIITSASTNSTTYLRNAVEKSIADKVELISSLSADSDTKCSGIVDHTLLSSSLDLFDSSNNSSMLTSLNNNESLHKNIIASKHHIQAIENETVVIENISPAKDRDQLSIKTKHDKACTRKVRFSLVTREYFYCDFDSVKGDAAPMGQRTLKSCLKLPNTTQNNEVELRNSQENSEDMFPKECDCEYISNKSLSSPTPYNDSVDLFCPSPNVSNAVKMSDTHNQTLPTNNYVHCSVGSLDNSLELFSQSQHCSTPIYKKNRGINKAEVQDCVTPDLFD